MYSGSISQEQVSLLNVLKTKEHYLALSKILKSKVLDGFQVICLLQSLIRKVQLVSLDTGLGKTLIAISYMVCLKNRFPNAKFIFFCKKDSLSQITSEIEACSDLDVCSTTAEEASIRNLALRNSNSYDIILATHDCLLNFYFNSILFSRRNEFLGVIVDEAHNVANYDTATGKTLWALMNRYEYRMMLTATPMTTSIRQTIRLLTMLDRKIFYDYKNAESHFIKTDPYSSEESIDNLEELKSVLNGIYFSRTRDELGLRGNYNPQLIWIKPHVHQLKARGNNLFITTKGPNAINQFECLKSLILERKSQGLRGLVYVDKHEVYDFLDEQFKSTGISFVSINGKMTNRQKRDQIVKDYRNGVYDVVFTNIIESLNFSCDYVIFYELTVLLQQAIGRGERGLVKKNMDILFMLTEGTAEVDYFIKNIYNRSYMLKEVLGKDNSVVSEIYRQMSV